LNKPGLEWSVEKQPAFSNILSLGSVYFAVYGRSATLSGTGSRSITFLYTSLDNAAQHPRAAQHHVDVQDAVRVPPTGKKHGIPRLEPF
jgi:hypothetical protein